MARLKSTEYYAWQAWTIAGISIATCVLCLGAIGVCLWLIIYIDNFALVIGIAMRNVFAGYASLVIFMIVCGLFGTCASITRYKNALMSYVVLLMGNLICQGGMWAFIYLEREKVSENLLHNIEVNPQYHDFLEKEFKCTLPEDYTQTALKACRDDVNAWLKASVWGVLGLATTIMAFQLLLLVTSAMLRKMVMDLKDKDVVETIHVRPWGEEDFDQQTWLQEPLNEHGQLDTQITCNCPCHRYESVNPTRHHRTVIRVSF